MSIIWAAGWAGNSSLSWQRAQRTVACPVCLSIVTLTASSPHRGQVKTVGSFFLTILTTRRLLLPNPNRSHPRRGRSQYLPLVRGSSITFLESRYYYGTL